MFLLDTTTVSDYFRGHQKIIDCLKITSFKLIYISSITKFELEYGLLKRPNLREQLERQLNLSYNQVNDVGFETECALVAAGVKNRLFLTGTPIGSEDFYIGAVALHHDFTVITSNTRHFSQIEGLKFVDW